MTLLSDAFTAYLGPLLQKHSRGEPLVWEDLEASRAASLQVLKSHGDNAFVSKRVDDLHQTQIQAYREAAVKSLREWAQTEAPLQPMEDHDTQDSFVERCVNAVLNAKAWPRWRLDNANMVLSIELRKRARATYAKYAHPPAPATPATTTVGDPPASKAASGTNVTATRQEEDDHENDGGDDEDDDDGEVDEDGEDEDGEMDEDEEDDGNDDDDEEDGEDGQVEDNANSKQNNTNTSTQNAPRKKRNNNNNNRKKKVTARKKGTTTKQTRKGGARSRRGGRGGGNANKS
eukprot:CAMPEP_0176181314 /NCGR_PEP_ID=MMETSP0120_2-20121206/92903_1 /TAXON_ID=160619 /ORGANISM="Kryptoperidinium foliaceum, Strain CCMP 1326" /LENGTH=288 /DNA_ID=CAMNT_0017519539 /DNA_START=218 /DNA_END=1084 /DNA_ORIENTATION=-